MSWLGWHQKKLMALYFRHGSVLFSEIVKQKWSTGIKPGLHGNLDVLESFKRKLKSILFYLANILQIDPSSHNICGDEYIVETIPEVLQDARPFFLRFIWMKWLTLDTVSLKPTKNTQIWR